MPLVSCPHCGQDTLTITGWAEFDRCAHCGRPLADRDVALAADDLAANRGAPAAPAPDEPESAGDLTAPSA